MAHGTDCWHQQWQRRTGPQDQRKHALSGSAAVGFAAACMLVGRFLLRLDLRLQESSFRSSFCPSFCRPGCILFAQTVVPGSGSSSLRSNRAVEPLMVGLLRLVSQHRLWRGLRSNERAAADAPRHVTAPPPSGAHAAQQKEPVPENFYTWHMAQIAGISSGNGERARKTNENMPCLAQLLSASQRPACWLGDSCSGSICDFRRAAFDLPFAPLSAGLGASSSRRLWYLVQAHRLYVRIVLSSPSW